MGHDADIARVDERGAFSCLSALGQRGAAATVALSLAVEFFGRYIIHLSAFRLIFLKA
jgi:hypothetical protein